MSVPAQRMPRESWKTEVTLSSLMLDESAGERPVVAECAGTDAEAAQSAAHGADPQVAVHITAERPDAIVRDREGVTCIVLEDGHAVAVVPVQAILCAEPEEAVAILCDGVHRGLGEAVFEGDVIELDGARLADGAGCCTAT